MELIRPLVTEKGLTLLTELEAVEMLGDADQIAQVITNLLTNAIHYNKAGGEICLRTFRENGRAVLTVADTGVGIEVENLPHIFERFYRADKSRARTEGGTGLGLAIVKSIVEAHGGEISVMSEAAGRQPSPCAGLPCLKRRVARRKLLRGCKRRGALPRSH